MIPAQAMLHAATGLSLSKAVVERAIRHRMEQTSARDVGAYLGQMTPEELEALVELVVVPESWFYRDPQAFHAAAEYVGARLAAAPERMLRILSLPCAGGEEPYTMAMVLSDAGIPHDSFIIDAADISQECLERARNGIYGRNAFRNQDLGFRERHFTVSGEDEFRINDDIRRQVRFKQGNILESGLDARAGYYDVIFCRNLLIYFDKPTTRAAITALDHLLRRDGLLFVGYAEVPSLCQNGFTPLPYAQAFGLVRKWRRNGASAHARRQPRRPRRPCPPCPPCRRRRPPHGSLAAPCRRRFRPRPLARQRQHPLPLPLPLPLRRSRPPQRNQPPTCWPKRAAWPTWDSSRKPRASAAIIWHRCLIRPRPISFSDYSTS